MKKIIFKFDEIFAACVKGKRYRDRELLREEVELNKFLRGAHKVFRIHGFYNIIYLYRDESVLYGWNKDFLISLYEKKLVPKKVAGRFYYDKLKLLAPDNKCQICFYGEADSLDHYLPKELFPSLTISPYNLIPSCFSCNGKKSTYVPKTESEQTIHSRFDKFFRSDWLGAAYSDSEGKVVFSPNNKIYPRGSIGFSRICNHMKVHDLDALYETLALKKLKGLVALAKKTGQELRDIVILEIDKIMDNSEGYSYAQFTFDQWKLAACKALLESEYFLANGMRIFGAVDRYYLPDHDFD
ncbi:HNH endonuclease signature motif containing protein [Pseudomonas alliivorans]|nr:HNH endonuclease signature motif containing protein [Pseudomonas alliivorans]MEE4921995.1 HNH endonuclease signature motif containing protein [Pseudomonas alliivorans]